MSAAIIAMKEGKLRKLVDERGQFEIIPNGHSSFLTKAAQKRLEDGLADQMDRATLEALLPAAAAKKPRSIPEPTEEYGFGKSIVTLRLRALPGRRIPDLAEGDCIAGMLPSSYHSSHRRQHFASAKEFVERTGYREFRILDVYWGTKTLVNLHAEGRGSARSTSDTNAFVVCESIL